MSKKVEAAILQYRAMTLANTADKGKEGKVLDVETRNYLMKNGIKTVADCKCRPLGKTDVRVNHRDYEIKTGSGAVAYATDNEFTKADCIAANVIPDKKYVIWFPWPREAIASGDPFKYGYVFTRQQFIDILDKIGKNGLASSLKISKGGKQINIQTISSRLEVRLFDEIESIPTIKEYFGK